MTLPLIATFAKALPGEPVSNWSFGFELETHPSLGSFHTTTEPSLKLVETTSLPVVPMLLPISAPFCMKLSSAVSVMLVTP